MAGTRNVSRILLDAIRYNGLKEEKNRPGIKVPELIFSFLLNQFPKCTGNKENIKIIYTVSGSLFGYAYVNDEDKTHGMVTFVCYKGDKELTDRAIFTLDCVTNNIGSEDGVNIVVRLIFIDNENFFKQKEVYKDFEKEYKNYTCDYTFYSKIPISRFQGVVAGKLVSFFAKLEISRMVSQYKIQDRPELHDIVLSLNSWKNSILKNSSIVLRELGDILSVALLPSFLKDRTPKGKFANNYTKESLFGFERITFYIPFTESEIKENPIVQKFIKELFGIALSYGLSDKDFTKRFGIYIPTIYDENGKEKDVDTYFDQFTYRNSYVLKDFTNNLVKSYFEHPND